MLVYTTFLTAFFALQNGIISQVLGYQAGVWTMYASTVLFVSVPFAARRNVPNDLLAHLFLGIIYIDLVVLLWSGGAFSAVTAPYVTVVPLMAILLLNRRAGFYWMIIVCLSIAVISFAQLKGVEFESPFSDTVDAWFKLSAYIGVVILLFFVTKTFDLARERAMTKLEERNVQLDESRKRSDNLLLNILPEEIAQELKDTGKAKSRSHPEVSILFSDFVRFTHVAEQLQPEELVELIDDYFSAFDDISSRFELEKIKTIGDEYMVASGLPVAQEDHAERMVAAALEWLAFIDSRKDETLSFQVRIGIHSGPVTAGVVGSHKFAYDIWGDAVNVAARMQSSGVPGRVNISGVTYERVRHLYPCTYRGKIGAKNKGAIDMYLVD